jgi:hypothetical protein
MLLRAAIVMCVMLNLGAAGWWVWQPLAAPAQTTINATAPSLQLVDEQPPAAAVDTAAPAEPAVTPATVATPTVAAAAVCLRFGPFASSSARDAARVRLQQAGVEPRPHDSPAREVRGWKVYLPAQASREAALALAEKIKSAGVADLFVMTQGDDINSIALGRFGSEPAAQRRQSELQGKGFSAQVAAIGGIPAQTWLDARLPQSAHRVDLVRIAPAQPLDCSALR